MNRRSLLRAIAALPVIGTTLAEAMAEPAELNELAAERIAEFTSRPTRGPQLVLEDAFVRRLAEGQYSLLNLRSLTWQMVDRMEQPVGQSRTIPVVYDPEKMAVFTDSCAVFDNDEARAYQVARVNAYYGRDRRQLGHLPVSDLLLTHGNTLTLDFSARGVFSIAA